MDIKKANTARGFWNEEMEQLAPDHIPNWLGELLGLRKEAEERYSEESVARFFENKYEDWHSWTDLSEEDMMGGNHQGLVSDRIKELIGQGRSSGADGKSKETLDKLIARCSSPGDWTSARSIVKALQKAILPLREFIYESKIRTEQLNKTESSNADFVRGVREKANRELDEEAERAERRASRFDGASWQATPSTKATDIGEGEDSSPTVSSPISPRPTWPGLGESQDKTDHHRPRVGWGSGISPQGATARSPFGGSQAASAPPGLTLSRRHSTPSDMEEGGIRGVQPHSAAVVTNVNLVPTKEPSYPGRGGLDRGGTTHRRHLRRQMAPPVAVQGRHRHPDYHGTH